MAVIKKGVHTIYYDASEHSHRQRLTVAHELGHKVLGH
ncbi:ImmA/IrrE family metallo-endopeptidase, partial [Salmonella enterica subsp. enterica serovar Infantis]